MPRPADETMMGSGGGGFGPAAGTSENLGQIDVGSIHDLDVDGATQNAIKLAAVFSKATGAVSNYMQKDAAQQQDAAEKQGELDGTTGNVDQDKANATIYGMASQYAVGAARAQTTLAATTAAAKAHALFEQNPNAPLMDSTDKDGNKVPGLVSQIDNIFANAVPNAGNGDAVAANIVGPLMQHTLNEITGLSYQHKVQQDQQTAEDAQTGLLLNDIRNGSNMFNVPYAMDSLTKVYGGDQRMAREALTHVVGEAAVQSGNPDLIGKYLPQGVDFGGGATLTPTDSAYLDGAKNRATVAQQRTYDLQLKSAGMNVATTIGAGKDPQAALNAYAALPGASPEFYKGMLDWFRNQGADKSARVLDSNDAADLQAQIAMGKIGSIEQAQQWVASKGYNAGPAVQLVQHAAGWLESVQRTNSDDVQFKAMREQINSDYLNIDPITKEFTSVAAKQLHANVLTDYISGYTDLVNKGMQPSQAAQQAAKQARDHFPIVDQKGPQKPPANDNEAAAFIRNTANRTPAALRAAGIDANRIKALRDNNLLSGDEAAAAMRAYTQR